MTDQELLSQARELKEAARIILEDEGLLPLIESYGPALVVGSYALDLMTWPDIDISMQLSDEKDIPTFFDLGKEITLRLAPWKMGFDDMFLRDVPSLPDGLYWGMRLNRGARAWKVDIWGFGRDAFEARMREFDHLRERLMAADRLAVLRIKAGLCLRPEYRKTVTSMDVYRAVMVSRVRTVEEFDAWLCERMRDD